MTYSEYKKQIQAVALAKKLAEIDKRQQERIARLELAWEKMKNR